MLAIAMNTTDAPGRDREPFWGLDLEGVDIIGGVSVFDDFDVLGSAWTAKDPIGFGGGTTNLYEYVGNDPSNRTDPTGLILVPGDNAGAGLIASLASSGGGARQLLDIVDDCSATFQVFGDLGVPDAGMCNYEELYGRTGNGPDESGWERGSGANREVDIRVDYDRTTSSADGIDPDRLAAATFGHELIHAALFCEALRSDPAASVLEGGGIPVFDDMWTTVYVINELMK